MSIRIKKDRCVGCGRCIEACPGNLICISSEKRAVIAEPEDCWGCTSCLKECSQGAIIYFLGADIGGRGGYFSLESKGNLTKWTAHLPDGKTTTIEVDGRQSNRY